LREAARVFTGPVLPLKEIASLRGARLVENASLRLQGYTHAAEGDLVIEICTTLAETRQRFTIAHEIGHTFFFDAVVSSTGAMTYHRTRGFDRATAREEGWCHNFAGDLLVPDVWLREETRAIEDPSIDVLIGLAAKYRVALEPLISQLARYRVWPTMMVFVTARRKGPVVRRVYTAGHGRTHLRPGQPLPDKSAPARAAETGDSCSAAEDWLTVEGISGSYLLECKRVGDDVLTLVHVAPSERTAARLADAGMFSQRLLFAT
jgi:hypothetical protein